MYVFLSRFYRQNTAQFRVFMLFRYISPHLTFKRKIGATLPLYNAVCGPFVHLLHALHRLQGTQRKPTLTTLCRSPSPDPQIDHGLQKTEQMTLCEKPKLTTFANFKLTTSKKLTLTTPSKIGVDHGL